MLRRKHDKSRNPSKASSGLHRNWSSNHWSGCIFLHWQKTVIELVLCKIILPKSYFFQKCHFARCHLCHFGNCTITSKYLWPLAGDGLMFSTQMYPRHLITTPNISPKLKWACYQKRSCFFHFASTEEMQRECFNLRFHNCIFHNYLYIWFIRAGTQSTAAVGNGIFTKHLSMHHADKAILVSLAPKKKGKGRHSCILWRWVRSVWS